MKGKIIKGVGGFYYVHLHDNRIFECKAKGAFRNQGIKPAVGDDVRIAILDEDALLGNMEEILPRSNKLIRPAVANVDQALIVFALAEPEPNFNLLDRFLIMMDQQDVKTIIVLNKADLAGDNLEAANTIKDVYKACGYDVIITSTYSTGQMLGIDELKKLLHGKTTVFAGPSGVGKSSLLKTLSPEQKQVKTGAVSEKIKRGKHTTRHSELMCIAEDTFIMDTPGFSSLFVGEMEPENLKDYYEEFTPYRDSCRFHGCIHIHEPDCAVKQALEQGRISELRYRNYTILYEELKQNKKW